MQFRADGHRNGTRRGRFIISPAVRKGVTPLGDKVLGHVAERVLLPYYMS